MLTTNRESAKSIVCSSSCVGTAVYLPMDWRTKIGPVGCGMPWRLGLTSTMVFRCKRLDQDSKVVGLLIGFDLAPSGAPAVGQQTSRWSFQEDGSLLLTAAAHRSRASALAR